MGLSNVVLILVAMILVLLNAFFVAAEFGMVKMRATRVATIKDNPGLRSRILYQIHDHLDAYLSACQLGITLVSLGLGWIGEPAFAYILRDILEFIGITSLSVIKATSFMVAFAIITFLHIVIGELMPKTIAIRNSEVVSMWTAVPLYAFYWLMYPIIFVLNSCSNFFLRCLRFNLKSANEDGFYSSEEIRLIIDTSHMSGELGEQEATIMEHTIDLGELDVTDIMRPADDLIMLNINQPIEDILQKILETKYTRYPIFDTANNQIIGSIHSKDLFAYLLEHKEIKSLTPIMRPILKVQHNLPALNLVHKFRDRRTHLALIYENLKLIGFVTLDNLLHVIIGKINDEFHRTHDDWSINPDGTITVKGSCSLYYLERALDSDLLLAEDEEDLDTIVELIAKRLGRVPKQGDKIIVNGYEAVVQEVVDGVVDKIIMIPA